MKPTILLCWPIFFNKIIQRRPYKFTNDGCALISCYYGIDQKSCEMSAYNYFYYRKECIDLKKINQEQQNVILALKKDLAGAQARLSVSRNLSIKPNSHTFAGRHGIRP